MLMEDLETGEIVELSGDDELADLAGLDELDELDELDDDELDSLNLLEALDDLDELAGLDELDDDELEDLGFLPIAAALPVIAQVVRAIAPIAIKALPLLIDQRRRRQAATE